MAEAASVVPAEGGGDDTAKVKSFLFSFSQAQLLIPRQIEATGESAEPEYKFEALVSLDKVSFCAHR